LNSCVHITEYEQQQKGKDNLETIIHS